MALQKRERITLRIIMIGTALALLLIGGQQLFISIGSKLYERQCSDANNLVQAGQSFVLDSSEDESLQIMGTDYRASFDWNGSMEMRVCHAKLFDSAEEVAASLGHQDWMASLNDKGGEHYLVVQVNLKNLDATPVDVDYYGNKTYSASCMRLLPTGELVAFDACCYGPGETRAAFNYELGRGTEKTFLLVYKTSVDVLDDSMLAVGMGSNAKYAFSLSSGESFGEGDR